MTKDTTVCIVGLGYIGLMTAAAYLEVGLCVIGIESDEAQTRRIACGEMALPAWARRTLMEATISDRFNVNSGKADEADCFLVCVPPSSSDPVSLNGALYFVAENLRRGHVIILQSTLHPGTTRAWAERLGRATGLLAGTDFYLAHSPERINPGDKEHTIKNTPRLVGGLTPDCQRFAMLYLSRICDNLVPVSTPEIAELAKLLENTYRLVNIALVNEIAELARLGGVDIYDVVEAAATKPFGYAPFSPGTGAGGQCIPVVPRYLAQWAIRLGHNTPIINAALAFNDALPERIAEQIAECEAGAVLIVGIAFKPGQSDYRNSQAVKVISALRRHGIRADFYDPYVAVINGEGINLNLVSDNWYDVAAVMVNHPSLPWNEIARVSRSMLDFCGAMHKVQTGE